MKAKKCVFCHQSSPKVKMSKEHIFRKKLKKLVGLGGQHFHWHQGTPRNNLSPDLQLDYSYKQIPHSPYESTINSICKVCNETWLNDIENNVEEFLVKLAKDEDVVEDKRNLKSLALWGYKTAAVRALMDKGERVIPAEKYLWVRENLSPPSDTFIWIFKGMPAPDNFFSRNLRHRIQLNNSHGTINFHETTIQIGKLVIYVLGFDSPAHGLSTSSFDEIFNNTIEGNHATIWPQPKVIDFGSKRPLNPQEILKISSIFSDLVKG